MLVLCVAMGPFMFALPIYSLTMNIALNAGCYSEVEVLSLDEATGMSGEAVEDLLFEKVSLASSYCILGIQLQNLKFLRLSPLVYIGSR